MKAKKSLGQNFLNDEDVLNRIIQDGKISQEDVVIEIGPGKGALTERLSNICKKVIAIELDDRLIEILHTKFVGNKNVEIIHSDILKINLPELIEKNNIINYKIVANIPYYITAPIIRLLLETKYPPQEMILMVQKEVAERIVAEKGGMSILAVSVQYYARAEILFGVLKTSFDPVPKVDSAIIKISPIKFSPSRAGEAVDTQYTKNFFKIVRIGFSAKRKTLANNISASLHLNKKEVEEKLILLGFSKNTRAQELDVNDWKKIQNIF